MYSINQDPATHRPPPLHWLTVLRYPAAIWVVAIHCLHRVPYVSGGPPIVSTPLRMFIDRGFLGVSFFFMLSGFILAWNYPVITSVRSYLTARAARILPVYYLALLFSLPILVIEIHAAGFHLIEIAKGLMVLTLTQSWIPRSVGFWNGPAWTLSCEAFFYCSLPWMLPVVTRYFSGKSLGRLATGLAVLWLLGLVAPTLFFLKFGGMVDNTAWLIRTQTDHVFAREVDMKRVVENFPPLRILEFIGGVVLCAGIKPYIGATGPRRASALLVLGAAWVCSSMFLPFIFSMGTWCLPGFACIIAGAAMLPAPPRGGGAFSLALLLGNASYAVYLFHIPIIEYLLFLCPPGICPGIFSPSHFLLALFVTAVTLVTAASIAIFHRFEEPMRVRVKNLLAAPRRKQQFPETALLTTDL